MTAVMKDSKVPQVVFQSTATRRSILASYWTVILLAFPLWWFTTDIERLPLPRAQVQAESKVQVHNSVTIHLEWESIASQNRFETPLRDKLRQCIQSEETSVRFLGNGEHEATDSFYNIVMKDSLQSPSIHGKVLEIGIRNVNEHSISDLICKIIVPNFSSSDEHRTFQYSSHYRLAFSLLNEDASDGDAITEWEINSALDALLLPTLTRLSAVHNFSIESQVQLHAPLAFPLSNEGDHSMITNEQLSIFVNSAEWTLASGVTNDPVLHFIIYIPAAKHRPLYIENEKIHAKYPQSLLVPRWGGVVIYNPDKAVSNVLDASDLRHIFPIFRSHLLQLLGVPALPTGLSSSEITDWQLDALLRRRSHENIRDSRQTLGSILRLLDSIANIPVGKAVQNDVRGSLAALNTLHQTSSPSPLEALRHSAEALLLSSRAFFHPTMLGMLYFPAEHTYAVYLPLFAPALMPLVVALIKELKAWRLERRKRSQTRQKIE